MYNVSSKEQEKDGKVHLPPLERTGLKGWGLCPQLIRLDTGMVFHEKHFALRFQNGG